jgi:hypothetical protein
MSEGQRNAVVSLVRDLANEYADGAREAGDLGAERDWRNIARGCWDYSDAALASYQRTLLDWLQARRLATIGA